MRCFLFPGTLYSPPARYRVLQFKKFFGEIFSKTKIIIPLPDRKNNYPLGFAFFNKIVPKKISHIIRIFFLLFQTFNIRQGSFVIINRDITPDFNFLFFEKLIIKRGAKLIFDFDDAIFLGARKEKIKSILKLSSAVVCGNNFLLNFAKKYNVKSFLIPTVVDTNYYAPSLKTKSNTINIGWIGSEGTRKKHLPLLKTVLVKLSKELEFNFHIMADSDPQLNWENVKISFFKWGDYDEIDFFNEIDIGVMPLTNDEFDKGKCGFKAIQFMSCEIPVVAFSTQANGFIINHNKNGFLTRNYDEWYKYLKILILDNDKRFEFGKKARQKIKNNYSLNLAKKRWLKVIKMIER